MALSKSDPSSFSNPEECKVVDIGIYWNVNFDKQTICGSVVLTVNRIEKSCKNLILDTRDISVSKVRYKDQELKFQLGAPVKAFGSKLDIELPSDVTDTEFKLDIEYETSPQCTALQWMSPEQTAGKRHSYLFSQCQAIHARSLLPCQDTPAVKAPYTAQVTHPADLVGLMSAVKQNTSRHPTDPDRLVVSKFEQKIPIPSYLIAVVVGALESRKIGPRSTVWSEKETIEAAEYEFAETEQMLAAAENLMGPYVWGVYDLLVLPPSFPYGGMENPCLTFVTPTLLAGDRSLANVVAHEIAHSWTGNLVTNKNPEHFWLNEGHTVFVERKIVGRLQGEPSRHFAAMGGWKDLQYQVDVFGAGHAFTQLVPDLTGVDPDDAFSTVPYEKGSSLLMYLEQKLGGNEVFEGFLKAYIERFKNKSITTDDWKEFLYQHFSDKKAVLDEVDWNAWFHSPGMPPVKPKYDESLARALIELSDAWCQAPDEELGAVSTESLLPAQLIKLLAMFLEKEPLSQKKIEELGKVYHLEGMKNSEIRFRWLRLKLRARLESAIEQTLTFVNEQGRMKFVRPLYRDLYQWDVSKDKAIENYKKNSKYMHTLTATMVGKDLKLVS